MKLKNICLGIAVILTSTAFAAETQNAGAAEASARQIANNAAMVGDFKKATGLQEGEYRAKRPSSTCFEGDLEIFPVENYMSIMVGGQLLISEFTLGHNTASYDEENCKNQVVTDRVDKTLTSTHTQQCGKDIYINTKTVVITPTKINYTVVVKTNGKVTTNVSCELVKK